MECKEDILFGNCMELMKNIPDGSIDMILADLPYSTKIKCKWDELDLDLLWKEYKRIIKPNGAIVLTAVQPFSSMLVMSNIKWFKYNWVWEKPQGSGQLNSKKQPMKNIEDVLVFYKKQCTYNIQWEWGIPYGNKSGKTERESKSQVYGKHKHGPNTRTINDGRRFPKQVLKFNTVKRGILHPTQKPLDMFRYLIRTYTNEGELVLDNTAGSGTTAEACIIENRQFIVMENDLHHFETIKNRVLKAKNKKYPQPLFDNQSWH